MPIVLRGFDMALAEVERIKSNVTKKKILATAVRKALEPLRVEMDRTAPDDFDTPGNRIQKYLRKSVVDQSGAGVLGRVGVTPAGFAGYLQEWGTDHMGAHPFAQPSLQRTQSEIVLILGRELWSAVLDHNYPEEPLDG